MEERPVQYARGGGLFTDDCWWQLAPDGKRTRLKRVALGLAVPQPDERRGLALVLAEHYQPTRSPTFTALGARVGSWTELQGAILELRRRFEPELVVADADGEETLQTLRIAPGLRGAPDLHPVTIVAAEKHAFQEIARDQVNQLIKEERLHLAVVQAKLKQVPGPTFRAVQGVTVWLMEHAASYRRGLRSIKSPSYGWTRAEGETPRVPFRRDEQ